MGKSWSDSSSAQKMRDLVERIVKSVIANEMPTGFLAEVYSIDRATKSGTCRTPYMAEDEDDLTFYWTNDLVPTTTHDTSGDAFVFIPNIVEIEGLAGNYRLKRIVAGVYSLDQARLYEHKHFAGQKVRKDVVSHFVIDDLFNNSIAYTQSAGRFYQMPEYVMESSKVEIELAVYGESTARKSYEFLIAFDTATSSARQVLIPTQENGSSHGVDYLLEVVVDSSDYSMSFWVRKTGSVNTYDSIEGPTLDVKIHGRGWNLDNSQFSRGLGIPSVAMPLGRLFQTEIHVDESAVGSNSTGPFQSGTKHLMEVRAQRQVIMPRLDWDGLKLKWQDAVRVVGMGVGWTSSLGYMEILPPAVGEPVYHHGLPTTNQAVDANGKINMRVNLDNCALYVDPVYCGNGQTGTTAKRLHLVGADARFRVPSHWILIAATNKVTGGVSGNTLLLGDGSTTDFWRTPTWQNGWQNYNAMQGVTTFEDVFYRMIGDEVQFKGLTGQATAANANLTMFTLPVGMRPLKTKIFASVTSSRTTGAASAGTAHTHNVSNFAGRFDINNAGQVTPLGLTAAANQFLSLDGITFIAEQ